MKQFIAFILLALYVVGVIGGLGYVLVYGGYMAYPTVIGIIATAYLAFPKAKELFRILMP